MYEPQSIYLIRNAVISPNKQNTYGTAIVSASISHRMRFDGGAFASIAREFRSDLDRVGKGHPFATERQVIQVQTGFQFSGEVTDFLAGWLHAFMMGKDVVSGVADPYTHTFTFDETTSTAPVTTVYFRDTNDVKYKMVDLAMAELNVSGSDKGPLQFSTTFRGSGNFTDGADVIIDAVALPTNTYLLGSATDILIGPVGAPVSIKERVRGWSIKITQDVKPHYAPGGGLVASFVKRGPQRVSVSLQVAAKDVDDIRTTFINDTIRELQINTVQSVSRQLTYAFKGVYFSALSMGLDGNEEIWNIEMDDAAVQKNGVNEILTATVLNAQATAYLVGA